MVKCLQRRRPKPHAVKRSTGLKLLTRSKRSFVVMEMCVTQIFLLLIIESRENANLTLLHIDKALLENMSDRNL